MNTKLSNELDAVNVMLSAIGEAPVNELRTANTSDVALAQQILGEQNREVQSVGWSFNTDYDYDLAVDGDGEVVLPPNVLRLQVDLTRDRGIDPVQRGTKLYDRKNKTFQFSKAVRLSKLVTLLDFEELPQSARWYITLRSARIFAVRTKGNDAALPYSQQDEITARATLVRDQADTDGSNMLDAPGTAEIVNRRYIPRSWL